jgi:acetyl-CoA acetyltransferase
MRPVYMIAGGIVASGRYEVVAAMGFETMSHVETAKGNEFIALASDTNYDFPVGGYYAMMVVRHMHEFGTTEEQLAKISVKNHNNACHNPYAQKHLALTISNVMQSEYVAWPLKRHDICVMSDGAAVCFLASEKAADRFCATRSGLPASAPGATACDSPTGPRARSRCCHTRKPATTRTSGTPVSTRSGPAGRRRS